MSRTGQGWAAVPTDDATPLVTSRSAKSAQPAAAASLENSSSYAGPKTRQRIHKPPEPLAVPDIDEDAAERKRVLNVLAQRRYRERRRQKKAAKTSGAKLPAQASAGDAEMADAQIPDMSALDPDTSPGVDEQLSFMDLPAVTSAADIDGMVAPSGLGDLDITAESMALASFEFDLSLSTSLATMAAAKAAETGNWGMGAGAVFSEETSVEHNHNSLITRSAASPRSPSPSTAINPLLTFGNGSSNSGNTYTDLSSVSLTSSSYGISSSSNSSVTDHLSPDSYFFPMTELTLMRAVMRISERLGCTDAMWQIDGQSPFLESNKKKGGSSSPNTEISAINTENSIALLPPNWRPTRAQRFVPHHPALDILPWPSVREKLIGLFSLPLDERPPIAADPLALVHLIYDLEDSAEGLRIWGSDPYDPTCWEVGQLVFERWWFIFDRDIIEQSNRWRELRGASRLRAVRTDTRTKNVMDMVWA